MICGNSIQIGLEATNEETAFIEGTLQKITDRNITSIFCWAFAGCSELEAVNFPYATYVDHATFYGCVNLTEINLPRASQIGMGSIGAFEGCASLSSVFFPIVQVIGRRCFADCTSLERIDLPSCLSIYSGAFHGCFSLSSVSLPLATFFEANAFYACSNLSTISLPKARVWEDGVFDHCVNLVSLYLLGSSVCSMLYSQNFISTPIGGYSDVAGRYGNIYVPASLYNEYISDSKWSWYASRIVSVA